jgi:hypothetical protein
MKPNNLKALLRNNKSAKDYFKSLPTGTQSILKQTAGDIETEEELYKYADDIFHSGGLMM